MKAFKSFFKPIDPTIEYDPEELQLGIQVELEHTPYKTIAITIAKHHLSENPKFYTNLKLKHTEKK
jgi:hypothetical protein